MTDIFEIVPSLLFIDLFCHTCMSPIHHIKFSINLVFVVHNMYLKHTRGVKWTSLFYSVNNYSILMFNLVFAALQVLELRPVGFLLSDQEQLPSGIQRRAPPLLDPFSPGVILNLSDVGSQRRTETE